MLPRKALSIESVFRLIIWLVVGCLGMAAIAGAAGPWLKTLTPARQLIVSLVLGSLGFHGVILAGVAWILRREGDTWTDVFGIGTPPVGKAILAGLLTGVVATPLAVGLQVLSGWIMTLLKFEPVEQQVVENLKAANSLGERLCFAVVTIVLAPVAEELLFRGVLYASLKRSFPVLGRWMVRLCLAPQKRGWRRRKLAAALLNSTRAARGRVNARRVSMVVVSLLFAAIHGNLLALLPLFGLAMTLAWLYERTGNLLAPVMTHSLFNAVNFLCIVLDWDV